MNLIFVFISENLPIKDDNLHSLLLLPNLEKLNVGRSTEAFQFMEPLPEVEKLTDFVITFDLSNYAVTERFCNAVKMMPKLQSLEVRNGRDEEKLKIAFEVIIMAASQGKDVILQECLRYDEDNFNYVYKIDHLKIKSRRKETDVDQILNLGFDNVASGETFFDDVMTFVKNKVKSHRAYMLVDA